MTVLVTQKHFEVNIIFILRSYGNLNKMKFIYRACRLHVFVPTTHQCRNVKKRWTFGGICYTLTDKIFRTILWGEGSYTEWRKSHITRAARQTSSVKQLFAILHKKKQHNSRSVNDELTSTNNKPRTCVIGTIYCDLLGHFPSVYDCYTNQWDLYFEIA